MLPILEGINFNHKNLYIREGESPYISGEVFFISGQIRVPG